ncbi:MAG: hypothetical protein ACRBCT_08970 [Alphaproteobacteria bacterium]
MIDAKDTQFRLSEDGVVSFQALESNPLAGDVIARLTKGAHVLQPGFEITDAKGADEAALVARLEAWFEAHKRSVMEPLARMFEPIEEPVGEAKEGEEQETTSREIEGVVKDIAQAVYDAMGILPREGLEALIAQLDAETRKDLRKKRIRLGPILVFIPALNKPAAVRLRALLWSLYHGKALPAVGIPNDGLVSCKVDEALIDKDFYQSIGYPVYGGRAIRIDMLDRVICAVYDGADKGKFQAQHQMAEWLGCPIEELYAILGAMGHVRILEDGNVGVLEGGEVENPAEGEAKPQEKQALDWFRLKRGKAFEKTGAGKKPDFKKKPKPQEFKGKPKGKRNKNESRAPKVMSAKAKVNPDDNPFAILGQLKE